jgi:malonyl-CoA O-methyltransferase
MTALNPREGYRLWAPTYSGETAVTHLETGLVDAMTPPLHGLRLLDAGCGTGRRLRDCGAASAVGIDICPDMLEAGVGIGERSSSILTMVGDVSHLPLPERSFDVLWCRLVLGHLADCTRAYSELARVADHGATIIISDFHPAAYAAGHRRTFRAEGSVHELAHHPREVAEHLALARSAGLEAIEICEAEVGPEIRSFYQDAGRIELYEEHLGLPLALAISFRRVS